MKQWLTELFHSWSGQDVLIAALVFLVTLGGSLAIVSFILVRLPADYFSTSSERNPFRDKHPVLRIAATVGKNLLGIILVLVGIILSIPGVPGQGVLTILLGVMLLDFPGKRRIEQNIVSRPKVRESIDRLRQWFGKPPLQLE